MTTVLHWYHISISIHALLAESDLAAPQGSGRSRDFYPRSPCGERLSWRIRPLCPGYFYPRSPCGERPPEGAGKRQPAQISIHALLAESDVSVGCLDNGPHEFLSTLSLRRATTCLTIGTRADMYFYPRSPCGERRHSSAANSSLSHFYPRSPCGERRCGNCLRSPMPLISIHALLAESDVTVLGIQHRVGISIHALLAESDRCKLGRNNREVISIHALLAESDNVRRGFAAL